MQYTTESINKLVTRLNILKKIWNDQVDDQINEKVLRFKRKRLLRLMNLRYKKILLIAKSRRNRIKQQLLRNKRIAVMRRTHWY